MVKIFNDLLPSARLAGEHFPLTVHNHVLLQVRVRRERFLTDWAHKWLHFFVNLREAQKKFISTPWMKKFSLSILKQYLF